MQSGKDANLFCFAYNAWNRTSEDLMDEWKGHQIFSIAKRAQDIDFDYAERGKKELYYLWKGLSQGIKALAKKLPFTIND